MQVERIGFDAWGTALPEMGFEVFHLPEALGVLDRHMDANCRLYAVRKGQETIALLPVFVTERSLGRLVVSPPPGWGVPRLGPLLMPNSPKRSKYEKLNTELAEAVLEDVDADSSTTLFRMACPLSYQDPRPFAWNDLTVEPRFTYVIDLTDAADLEEAMDGFSRSLRNDMRRLDDLPVTITTEGTAGAMRIYEDVERRFSEQSQEPPATRAFVRDVYDALDERCRAYVARGPDDEYLGGLLALASNDFVYYWLGGARSSYENVSVNTLIHRRIIEDVIDDPALDSVSGYDLVGANTERLCQYKAKFGGDLRSYYAVESSGVGMAAAKTAYRVISTPAGKS